MSGWIVGGNPLKGGADLQNEDNLKNKVNGRKAVQEQLNEKKNQFKEFVKDELKI